MATVDAPSAAAGAQYGSPPSAKVSLATWWEKFKKKPATKEGGDKDHLSGIFGVPLSKSIKYANVAISLTDANGEQFIYGYIPIVVAKCGVFLKEKATNVEGIFRLSGSAKRIKDLQTIFNSPDKYGKGLDWTGYTVHDAANIFRRYLNQLPEPIIPLDFYARFREPLQCAPEHFDAHAAIHSYQVLIGKLPALNRQLLLYILDLLAVFASKSEQNLMNASNLAAIFQPGLINHPEHDMSPGDYKLSQDVLVFLITNQDHFLLGMRGNAENEGSDHLIIPEVPPTPASPRRSKTVVTRSPSSSSAAADDVRKYGNLRRNVSVTSRRSTAGSPVVSTSGGGLGRSNTLPSKRSPGGASPINLRGEHTPSPSSRATTEKNFIARSPSTAGGQLRENANNLSSISGSPASAENLAQPRLNATPRTAPSQRNNGRERPHVQAPAQTQVQNHGRERPHVQIQAQPQPQPQPQTQLPVTTPIKERNFANFFSGLSPDSHDRLQRPGNKLRKKRITPNHSAESSTTTLPEGGNPSRVVLQDGHVPPTSHSVISLQSVGPPPTSHSVQSIGPPRTPHSIGDASLESVPPHATTSMLSYFAISQQGTTLSSTASSSTLMPAMSPTPSATSSVTSQSSSHEYSDTTNPSSSPEKKRSRWRLSGQKFESQPTSPTFSNGHGSTGSLAERIRKVSQSPPHRTRSVSGEALGMSDGEERRGAFGWLHKVVTERKHHQQHEQEKYHKDHGRTLTRREEMKVEIENLPKLPMQQPTPGSPRVQPPTPSSVSLPVTKADERLAESPEIRGTNSFGKDRQAYRGQIMYSSRSEEENEQIQKRESQRPLKRDGQRPRRPESQQPHRQDEVHHPHRPGTQLPRRVGSQKPRELENQLPPKTDNQQSQPQVLEGQQSSVAESPPPLILENRLPQNQPSHASERQQPQMIESQSQQQPISEDRLPSMPEGQQMNAPESQPPPISGGQEPSMVESQHPEGQLPSMPESHQLQMPEIQQPPKPEIHQAQALDPQQLHMAELKPSLASEGQQLHRRGSQQTYRQGEPVIIGELPLYAPVPGESIEPEGRGQGRRRPQAIRPGEPLSMHEVPAGLMSPPGTAL